LPEIEEEDNAIPWSPSPPPTNNQDMEVDEFEGIESPPLGEPTLPAWFDSDTSSLSSSLTSTILSESTSPVDEAITTINKQISALKKTIQELEKARNGLMLSKGPMAIRSLTLDASSLTSI
jgi:hypothetical protein